MADVSDSELAQAGLRLAIDGPIAEITLARPERRNALTFATWHAMARIGEGLPGEVRVVVVRAEGPSFSAGIDLRMLGGQGVPGQRPMDSVDEVFIAELQAGFLWLRRPEIISIAAVQGHAIGAGFQLALACDLRIMADDGKLCMKEAALGIVPDLTGTKPLVDIVGVSRALELCLTARTVHADEAARLGLAELVVPVAELGRATDDLVAAVLQVRPATSVALKRLLSAAPHHSLAEQAAAERREQVPLLRELFGADGRKPS